MNILQNQHTTLQLKYKNFDTVLSQPIFELTARLCSYVNGKYLVNPRILYTWELIDLRCKQQIFEVGSKSVNQSLIRGS